MKKERVVGSRLPILIEAAPRQQNEQPRHQARRELRPAVRLIVAVADDRLRHQQSRDANQRNQETESSPDYDHLLFLLSRLRNLTAFPPALEDGVNDSVIFRATRS